MDEQRERTNLRDVKEHSNQQPSIDQNCSLHLQILNSKLDRILKILKVGNIKPEVANTLAGARPRNFPRSPIRCQGQQGQTTTSCNHKARSRSSGQTIFQDLEKLASAQASLSESWKLVDSDRSSPLQDFKASADGHKDTGDCESISDSKVCKRNSSSGLLISAEPNIVKLQEAQERKGQDSAQKPQFRVNGNISENRIRSSLVFSADNYVLTFK